MFPQLRAIIRVHIRAIAIALYEEFRS